MNTTAYRLQFENVEGLNVTVYIYDTTSPVGTPTSYIEMEGSDEPFRLFTVNNDESIFTTIRALQAEIKILSSSTLNLSTFFTSDDNQFLVEAWVGSVLHFKGFLMLDDIDEDFLDSSTGNVITLVATDNIGRQKDQKLLTIAGANPRGYYTLAQYVAMVLYQTGLQLNINICHNVKEENAPTSIMYNSCFLQSKTFESDINESVDGYRVLEMILGEDAYLTQYKGEWWIFRLDELTSAAGIKNVFDYTGAYVSSSSIDLTAIIGPTQNIGFANSSTFVKPKQPVKDLTLTYPYSYPKEIIDNIDFNRGTWLSMISLGSYAAAYSIDDWTLQRVTGSAEISAYTKKTYKDINWTYIKEKYVVLTAGATAMHWLKSNPIPMHLGDKFNLSIDRKLTVDLSGTGNVTAFFAQVRLYGSDGTYWTAGNAISSGPEPIGTWVASNSTFTTNNRYLSVKYQRDTTKETDWMTGSIETGPLPVDGDVYVLLIGASDNGTGMETHFANLNMEYMPLINGDYSVYEGQHHKISQAINTKRMIAEDISISDSPKKLFKGALHRYNGTAYVLAGNFYDGIQFGSTVPAADYLHPFGENQAFAVWNKNNRPFRTFDFEVQGLNGSDIPALIHRFTIDEVSAHTTHKYFALVHFEMDFNLCTMKGILCEIDDTTINNVYSDTHEFKYITGK